MSYRDRDRDYYGGGGGGGRREWQRDRPARVSLVVRNLPIDTRPDELRVKFERYGQVRDVYIPRGHHDGRPRGFAFVEYRDALDAEDAVYQLDRTMYGGREITVAYSKESRKTPFEMLSREQRSRYSGRDGGRDRYDRDRHRSRSRSPDRRRQSRSRSRSRSADRRRVWSYSPAKRDSRSRSRSRSRDDPPRDSNSSPVPVKEGSESPRRSASPAREEYYD